MLTLKKRGGRSTALLQARTGATEQVALSAPSVDRHHVRQGLRPPADYSPLKKNSWPRGQNCKLDRVIRRLVLIRATRCSPVGEATRTHRLRHCAPSPPTLLWAGAKRVHNCRCTIAWHMPRSLGSSRGRVTHATAQEAG